MKLNELILLTEAKVAPDWTKEELAAFKALIKRFGFTVRQKPFFYKDRWTFGGRLVDTEKDSVLSIDKRVAGLQKAVARFMMDRKDREVVAFKAERYGYRSSGWSIVDYAPKYLYADDSLAHVENLVKDTLYNNRKSGSFENNVVFTYGLADPPTKEEPKQTPKTVRVVKGAK